MFCENCGKEINEDDKFCNFCGSEVISILELPKIKETPTLWKWYFGWHPRILLTIPFFLMFVYQGLWFIWAEISDIIFFFNTTPITWGAIFLILILGTFFIGLLSLPIYICFCSISWFYEININNKGWKRILYSIGIILLVSIGPGIIRALNNWILGIL